MNNVRTTLHDNWTMRPVGGRVPPAVTEAGPVPATVPGSVHTDLLAAGLIPDPYLDDNERTLAWIGLADWRYETHLDWTPGGHDRVDLVFDGLDTIARVEVSGDTVATTANMHRTYRVDVTRRLRPGRNSLAVVFASAVRYADRMSLELGARPHVNAHPFNAIRKAAYGFGWDWGPDLVGAGIWRPVTLHSWSGARLAAVRPVTTVEGDDGVASVHVDVERSGNPADLEVVAEVGGVVRTVTLPSGTDGALAVVDVPGVRRWWPRGHGEQPLYELTVRLRAAASTEVLDEWRGRIGFRTVGLRQTSDASGTGVAFVVNDREVQVKGANWIPDDAFPHRVDRQRYTRRVEQAHEAGVNLLRVWGGGLYEDDAFYDACDERGILTWQDFGFACAAYSESEPLRSEVEAEARDNVTRLMRHPSLVLWNGNNENLQGFEEWGWQQRLDGRTWGHGYYHDLLPRIVAELDPGRPYTPGSPWSPAPGRPANDPVHGTVHIWDVWNELDHSAYRAYRPRFVAEFGWQGPPTWSTLRRAISDDPLTPESPGMLAHQKAADGDVKLARGLVPHLRVPDTMVDWHWAMSLNQARAIRSAVSWFRSLSPLCTGTVVWQLNDCWPVVSWSAIDGDGRRKPVFYALRQAHADRLLTIQPAEPGGLHVALVNDTDEPWSGTLAVSRRSYGAEVLAKEELPVDVAPRTTARVEVPRHVSVAEVPSREVVLATLGDARDSWFFTEDRDSALPEQRLSAAVTPVAGGLQVSVTAQVMLRDLALLVDRVDPDAVVDDMLVSLLPGEAVTWTVRCSSTVTPDDLLRPDVLRSANQLIRNTGVGQRATVTGTPAKDA